MVDAAVNAIKWPELLFMKPPAERKAIWGLSKMSPTHSETQVSLTFQMPCSQGASRAKVAGNKV